MSNMDVLSWMCQPSVLRSMIGHNIKVGLNEFERRLGGDKDLYQDILCSGLIICTHVSVSRTQNLLNPATFESTREAQLTQNFKSLRGQSLDSSLLTPNLQTLNSEFQIPNPTVQSSNPQFPNPKARTPNLKPKIFKTRIPNPRPQNLKSRNSNRKPTNRQPDNPKSCFLFQWGAAPDQGGGRAAARKYVDIQTHISMPPSEGWAPGEAMLELVSFSSSEILSKSFPRTSVQIPIFV